MCVGVAIFIKENIEYTIPSDLSTFNEHIESVFIEINNDAMTINRNIVIGVIYRIYYNIDLLNSETHDLTNEFVDLMYLCSLNSILVADVSDLFPIFHDTCSFILEGTESCLLTRVNNEKNKQNFTQAISEVDWTEICNIPDTQESFDLFHSKLISLHEKCFPKIKIKKELL